MPLKKTAADRAVRNIRALMNAGDDAGADAMAKRYGQAGVLKTSPGGTQAHPSFRQSYLGAGEEGHVTKIITPQGIGVRKHFHEGGVLDRPAIRQAKVDAAQAIQAPWMARMFSHHSSPGKNIHQMEFVQGRSPLEMLDGPWQEKMQALNAHGRLQQHLQEARSKGFHLSDVERNAGNWVVRPDGSPVIIDAIPVRMSDMRRPPVPARRGNVQFQGTGLKYHLPGGVPVAELRQHADAQRARDVTDALRQAKGLGVGSRQAPAVPGAVDPASAFDARNALRDRARAPRVFGPRPQSIQAQIPFLPSSAVSSLASSPSSPTGASWGRGHVAAGAIGAGLLGAAALHLYRQRQAARPMGTAQRPPAEEESPPPAVSRAA